MKITVILDDGSRHKAMLPYDGAAHVTSDMACPHGCPRPVVMGVALRLKVRGTGIESRTHDTYTAPAVALCCGRRIGCMETRVSTVFGIDEDEAVLSGPWKVF